MSPRTTNRHPTDNASAPQQATRTIRQHRGDWAENAALQFLQKHGFRLIKRNYRSRFGEIDLIGLLGSPWGDTLLFIEVRYRGNDAFGGAAGSVNRQKQQRIRTTARYFMAQNPGINLPIRFDVVAIEGRDSINWIDHAYT